ncbi:MAG: M23 family metallopeptidase [Anaerolineales bacterium]|nr:M23 family metallopeptidase [Anaerolineales bacterium]
MKVRILTALIVPILLVFWIFVFPQSSVKSASPQPTYQPTPTPQSIEDQIRISILLSLTRAKRLQPIYELFDTAVEGIRVNPQQDQAVAYLFPVDPQTGEVIPTEPGLAILQLSDNEWEVSLPGDPNWFALLKGLPANLVPTEERNLWFARDAQMKALQAVGPFHGYRLPWAAGVTMRLTQSVAHDRYTPSGNAHYAFDFATPGPAQMFNLFAAKGGYVWSVKDDCPNGSETCSNWIVLRDPSTNPVTYQLYLHLARNSIPASIRSIGTFVERGQFIGVADDTGVSTAHHLHFMVHTNPSSYWGTSVDITFEDVDINGGRPRILADKPYCRSTDVCEQFRNDYVSRNYYLGDQTPPYGDLLAPSLGDTIFSSKVKLEGWAKDDLSGLYGARFIVKTDSGWQEIGETFTTNYFSFEWDLCTANVSDGPVSVALRIFDKAGNQSVGLPGLRHFFKHYECPAAPITQCNPSPDQIAIFSESDYQGTCAVFSSGSYTDLGAVGKQNISSILIGSNVVATLFFNNNFRGRGETFVSPDANLADNWIGDKSASSLVVSARNSFPATPYPVSPLNNAALPSNSSVTFHWENLGRAGEFQVELTRSGSSPNLSPWLSAPYWQVGSLSSGTYTWRVRGRNANGTSSWSNSFSFSIPTASDTTPSNPVSVPFIDDFETEKGWSASSYFDKTEELNHTSNGKTSWKYDTNSKPQDGYDTGQPNFGFLTSPPIQLPASPAYMLRFWSYYQTESDKVHWDQRWVQISVDGGAFQNLYQFSDDPMEIWLQSPRLSLASFAGKTIQIRFYFNTLDKNNNKHKGWFIDDLSIIPLEASSCPATNEPNDTTSNAVAIVLNANIQAEICPAGDVDYYRFFANQGDRIGVQVTADRSNPDAILDPYLYLIDSDGKSVLVENDDKVHARLTDSSFSYQIKRTGDYYLKVKAFNHPAAGDVPLIHALTLVKDHQAPVGTFLTPQNNQIVIGEIFPIRMIVYDGGGIISHVRFYRHSANWESGKWEVLGEDWDGSDGWGYDFTDYSINFSIWARIFDLAGNYVDIGAWNLSHPRSAFFFPIIFR